MTTQEQVRRMHRGRVYKLHRDVSNATSFLGDGAESKTEGLEETLNPQLIRSLGEGEVLAFLTMKGSSWDDVLQVGPVYL